jgi:hypothetical protein
MKVVLTGMFNRQLQGIADELRAEFPEVNVEIVGNDDGMTRLHNAAAGAELIVAGRFVSHKHLQSIRGSRAATLFSSAGGSRGIFAKASEWLAKRAAPRA